MTRKVYKSAMGKPVDLGALLLQNEQVRAVGNMGVNAAGDLIDSTNRVIDQRNRQVQRQYRRQTNVNSTPVATSNLSARKTDSELDTVPTTELEIENTSAEPVIPVMSAEPVVPPGGLAAAMARSREIKQELEKTRRQQMQDQGLKKI
jgi:hypothetical protein